VRVFHVLENFIAMLTDGTHVVMPGCTRACTKGIYKNTCRKEEIMNQSRMWITEDNLDERVEYAVEHPVSLWESNKVKKT